MTEHSLTKEAYLAEAERLVSAEEYQAALDYLRAHGQQMAERLTLEELDSLGALESYSTWMVDAEEWEKRASAGDPGDELKRE
ncbi:MAG: hypothetical protein K0Q72_2805 [Armatimonadetes bacterium]|jgi:hypothetical protein|nr:hypothetical protein [Armatimonadota bacterium]